MITAARSGDRLGEDRVRALLRLQHPDLAGLPLSSRGRSWRLGTEFLVRLPRDRDAADRLCRQDRWLPLLAPGLPLAVPEPVRIGAPSVLFPRHWAVVRWVPGEVASALPSDDKSIEVLAGFLKALHVEGLVHGDLGPSTVVLAGGMPVGVIGFGQMREGDPAVDLDALGRWLPPAAEERLRAAYGADYH